MIEVLITPNIWLQITPETRNKLAKEFNMHRTSSPVCVTELGQTHIQSDGFTVDDLRGLNVRSMQEWLGFTTIDENANLVALLELVIKRIENPLLAVESVTVDESLIAPGAVVPISEPQIESEGVPEPVMTEHIVEETVESLRAKLDAKGIPYHHKAGIDKLKSLLV
jgi:hypothetical protein